MKRRDPSSQEMQLWQRVTRDVRRRESVPANPHPHSDHELVQTHSEPLTGSTSSKLTANKQKIKTKAVTKVGSNRATIAPASAFESGDPAMDKKVRRGRIVIEATLDLHGLTQVAARQSLQHFIMQSAAARYRCVLVITGKGMRQSDGEKGVLRRRFPDWVHEPELRPLITRIAPAGPHDGGSGAFYVFLKRR